MSKALRILSPVALLLTSALFITLFSPTTSPLNPRFGDDSAIFRFIGSAMTQGQTLYVDIWDHKGPVLFFIQWAAQALWPGRIGIFVVQILFLFGTLALLTAFSRRFLGVWGTIGVLAVFLTGLSIFFESGNLTEEFSLLFTMVVLVLLSAAWVPGAKPLPWWSLALAGAMFALLVFLRLNNSAAVIALFVTHFLFVLGSRQPFWRQFLSSLLGFFGVVTALVAGFWAAGALPQMVHATFLYNFRYTSSEAFSINRMIENGYLIVGVLICLVSLLGGTVSHFQTKQPVYLVLGASLALFTALGLFSSGTAYFHYLQIGLPALAVGTVLLLATAPPRLAPRITAVLVLAAVPLAGVYATVTAQNSRNAHDEAYAATVDSALSPVPDPERGDIFTWNVPSRYYLVTGTLPRHRFYTLQDWWGQNDPALYEELGDFLETDRPKWILVNAQAPIAEPNIAGFIEENYVEVNRTEGFVLLTLAE